MKKVERVPQEWLSKVMKQTFSSPYFYRPNLIKDPLSALKITQSKIDGINENARSPLLGILEQIRNMNYSALQVYSQYAKYLKK